MRLRHARSLAAATATATALMVLGLGATAPPARAGSAPAVLRVGSWHGSPGTYSDIQAAVSAAHPGDWILIGSGDFRPGDPVDPARPAGVLVQTPGVHLRGMDRNQTIVDGTSTGPACDSTPSSQRLGRNGIEVYKVDGVSVENLTVCNFLTGAYGGAGNQVWWNGGDGSGQVGMGSWSGAYLTATSTFNGNFADPQGEYGLFVSNAGGPGTLRETYASNMADSGYYVGACPDCQATIDAGRSENNALGFSGTNAGGRLVIENSTFDQNKAGIVPNVLNNDDAPPPQNGACPGGPPNAGVPLYSGAQADRCTVITNNEVYDNNNPNAPSAGIAGSAPVGTGIELVGTENILVAGNRVHDNGAWGIVVHDYPDTETPPPTSHCQGGISIATNLCYFQAFGNKVAGNTLTHNGYFGNPTNGDLGLDTALHAPGNCFVSNTDGAGVTSDPPNLQGPPWSICGAPNAGDSGLLTAELVCDSGLLGSCPAAPGFVYPTASQEQILPMPSGLPTMANPCEGVPANPWCG